MHIALNGWFWDQPYVGSGQYIRDLLPAMRKVAPEVRFSLILPGHITEPDEVPDGVEVIHTTGGSGDIAKVIFEQRTYPRAVARTGADIAHVPYWGPPLSSPARLVTSVLDVIPLAIPNYSHGFKARLYTSLVSAAARGSAHTITLSEASRQDIIDYLEIPAEKITPTYLAPDERYHPRIGRERDEEVRAKYNLPDRFVLYLGGFDIRKQVNQLLLAFTYMLNEEVPLVIAGKTPPWGTPMFPDLPRYAEELGISDDIQWVGYIDEADKPSIYRLADVYVFPSRYEGFGLTVLEAMACGTPVVANEVSTFPELVGDGAYLVEPGSARAMAGAIIALLNQEPLRTTQINNGLAQVTKFSWRKTARETLSVYEQVMRL
ncbi:MAG: glycosyltransferase family 4 protein [Anaerolineae bacterium]|nr:glycosyltransferase family 4 protein [Anaerolineae bacterium]